MTEALQAQITKNTEDIGRHDERIKGVEKDMDEAFKTIRGVAKEVSILTWRVALIVGGIAALSTAIQIFVK